MMGKWKIQSTGRMGESGGRMGDIVWEEDWGRIQWGGEMGDTMLWEGFMM